MKKNLNCQQSISLGKKLIDVIILNFCFYFQKKKKKKKNCKSYVGIGWSGEWQWWCCDESVGVVCGDGRWCRC